MTPELPSDISALDASDPLARFRDEFHLPSGVIYLDGNSLGALPKCVAARIETTVMREWGDGLIRSWNACDWIGLPQRVGAKLASFIGAKPHEVIAADSTSVNLFKLIVAAARLRPDRRYVVTELGNFPTDLYMIEGAQWLTEGRLCLRACETPQLEAAIREDVALVLLTHVHYKSGRMHDITELTRRAHAAGALVLWDLSHSAGAVEVDLNGARADFAVGCGYKYLNGGPGAPAFLFVAERHHADARSPLTGWLGHAEPFAFEDHYRPREGIRRHLCGTPGILGLAGLDASLDLSLQADMKEIARKGRRLGDLFIRLVEERCAGYGLELASPRDSAARGSHVALRHCAGFPIMQALIHAGVIGDFRAPDILRFGFASLYLRYRDVWEAATALHRVLESGSWREPRYRARAATT